MLLLLAVAVALASALLRQGRISALASVQVNGGWAVGIIIFIQIAVVLFAPASMIGTIGLVLVATQGFIGVILWINRAIPGFRLLMLGALLNTTVMAANGGYMPVTQEALSRAGHGSLIRQVGDRFFVATSKSVVLEPNETWLYPLSDIFTIPEAAPVSGNFSIGDFLIALGAGWFLHAAGGKVPRASVSGQERWIGATNRHQGF